MSLNAMKRLLRPEHVALLSCPTLSGGGGLSVRIPVQPNMLNTPKFNPPVQSVPAIPAMNVAA